LTQWAILILGGLAIWLLSRKEKWSRWGFIVGLISQPFWLYETFTKAQSGMFVLSLWYTYSWLHGIWNYWIKEN
jgi:hypothetical protein